MLRFIVPFVLKASLSRSCDRDAVMYVRGGRCGFSMAEMVLVLIVLVGLAAMVVPLLDEIQITTPAGEEKTEKQVVTEAAMRTIRDAIMGTPTKPGAWPDLVQRPDKFVLDPNLLLADLSVVRSIDPSINAYDPVTKLGWRGPYLTGTRELTDAWGNSFVIQIDFDGNHVVDPYEAKYARLVSSGQDGVLDTQVTDGYLPGDNIPASTEIDMNECGDDIVLFFRVADTRE